MREQEMNRALRATCDEIRLLLETADADEVATRHRVGALVAKVRDE